MVRVRDSRGQEYQVRYEGIDRRTREVTVSTSNKKYQQALARIGLEDTGYLVVTERPETAELSAAPKYFVLSEIEVGILRGMQPSEPLAQS